MHTLSSFDYAVIRVVPRVDREEFMNAGVIVFCLDQRFLDAQVHVDEARLLALWPKADVASISEHLMALVRICRGEPDAGPVAAKAQRERFHWLVAPRSTCIQVSAVHSGLCQTPAETLNHLFRRLVYISS
jgi:hypothetical protein